MQLGDYWANRVIYSFNAMTLMEDDMAYLVKWLWGNVWNDTEYEDVSRQNGSLVQVSMM